MLQASRILDIQSSRDMSDLPSSIFLPRDCLRLGAPTLRNLRGFVEKSSIDNNQDEDCYEASNRFQGSSDQMKDIIAIERYSHKSKA